MAVITMEDAKQLATSRGHDIEWDPSATGVARWTCKRCGRAVLIHNGVTWGSATENDCEKKDGVFKMMPLSDAMSKFHALERLAGECAIAPPTDRLIPTLASRQKNLADDRFRLCCETDFCLPHKPTCPSQQRSYRR
jgi:hypothetical protein